MLRKTHCRYVALELRSCIGCKKVLLTAMSVDLHDCVKSTQGLGKGKATGRQLHWEFVVRRGDLQIYPEFIIDFEM